MARDPGHFNDGDDTALLHTLPLLRSLQALARTGLHFGRDPYDRERYEQIERIAAELLVARIWTGAESAPADPASAGATGGTQAAMTASDAVMKGSVVAPRGIAAQVRAEWAREKGYVTPKVEVRGAVFRPEDGRVLLVRETLDGLWTLPGGWADVNDAPSGAIRREIEQETGFYVRVSKLAALFDRNAHGHPPSAFHSWKVHFLCEIEGGEARPSLETDAVEFFDPFDLPPMSLGRSTPAQVARMREHWLRPEMPTDFD